MAYVWKKLGRIYNPDGSLPWAKSYALIPTVYAEPGSENIRVYFSSLDEHQFGRISYLEVLSADPSRVVHVQQDPVLDLGELGTFDDSGVNASCVLDVGDRTFLYYIGWQRAERVPYLLFTGLAISEDRGRTFRRHSRAPILDRTPDEPFIRSAPSVILDNGVFRMWYVSGKRWDVVHGTLYPEYTIRYAESKDGLAWVAKNEAVKFEAADEFGFGRPWVVKDGAVYRMWYSIRSRLRPYSIGYAESKDGWSWDRKDEAAGITASPDGWDSQMICYSCVARVAGKFVMFYNGNRHGSTGLGVAVQNHSGADNGSV